MSVGRVSEGGEEGRGITIEWLMEVCGLNAHFAALRGDVGMARYWGGMANLLCRIHVEEVKKRNEHTEKNTRAV